MESTKIYEISHQELNKILKQSSTSNINIDITKLDGVTKNQLIAALRDVVIKRRREIEDVILGVK